MLLTAILDGLVVCGLLWIAITKGVERALPFFTFAVVLIPTDSKIQLGLFDLTTQRLALVTLIIISLVFGSKDPAAEKQSKLPLKILIGVHFLWATISTANSVVPMTSFKRLLSTVLEYYLLYFLFARNATKSETIQKIVTAMVAAMTIACALGVPEEYWNWTVMSLFDSSEGGSLHVEWGRGLRMHSTFVHPILFGGAIALVIPLAFYRLSEAKTGSKKLLMWISIILMSFCLYKTMSRGPWLGVMIALAIALIVGSFKLRRTILAVFLFAVFGLIIRPGVWDTLVDVYWQTMDPESPMGASYEYRYALYNVAKQALAKDTMRQVAGFGLESFKELHLSGKFKEWDHWAFISCDSSWIELWIETGYVGIVIFAFLIIRPARVAFRAYRKLSGTPQQLSVTLFAIFLSFYFMMSNVNMYSWGQNGYMVWILIATCVANSRLKQEEASPVERQPALPDFDHELVPMEEC